MKTKHPEDQRVASYTNVRTDVAGLIPASASRILDLGCSNGALGGYLKSQVQGRRIVGVEIDPEFAASARSVLDEVIVGNIEVLPIKDVLTSRGPFDCIICADVLEHLREPWALLVELVPLLAPGGTLIVSLPNIRHLSAFTAIYLGGRFPRRARGIFDGTHLRWFTWADGVELLSTAGSRPEIAEYSIRIGDRGGGLINRIAGRLLSPFAGLWLIREFFVYQFVIRARAMRDA